MSLRRLTCRGAVLHEDNSYQGKGVDDAIAKEDIPVGSLGFKRNVNEIGVLGIVVLVVGALDVGVLCLGVLGLGVMGLGVMGLGVMGLGVLGLGIVGLDVICVGVYQV